MNYNILFVCVILASFGFGQISCAQSISEDPKNVTVLVGEDATLRCKVKNQKGTVIWCKDSFCAFSRNRNFSDSRYSFIGDEANGEHHLRIKNVTIYDNANYQCQVLATDSDAAIRSEEAFLTVLIKPSKVEIVTDKKSKDDETIRIKTGAWSKLKCVAENSNPPCQFTWSIGSIELKEKENGVKKITTTDAAMSEKRKYKRAIRSRYSSRYSRPRIGLYSSAGSKSPAYELYQTISDVLIQINETDFHMKELKCECKIHSLAPSALTVSDSKTLIINYSPIAKIWKLTDADVLDGSVIQYECMSDARPPVTHYKWYIGDKVLSSGEDERFLYLRIEGNMHKQELKCDATNEVSTQTATHVMLVTHGPKFVEELPSHKMVHLNEKLVLKCNVESHPEAAVTWEFNGTNIYTYPTLRIEPFRPENYGTYKCTASLKHFPQVSSSMRIVPPGVPIISSLSPQYSQYGQKGTIQCLVDFEPKADHIEWYRFERRINVQESFKFKINNNIIDRMGVKSELVINDVNERDFGNYTCKASNVYGYSKYQILMKPKGSQLISYFRLTVVFVFVFIASSILVFFIILRFTENPSHRRRKPKKLKNRKSSVSKVLDRLQSKPSMMLGMNYRQQTPRRRRKSSNRNFLIKRNNLQNRLNQRAFLSYQNSPSARRVLSPVFNVTDNNHNYELFQNRLSGHFVPIGLNEEPYETFVDTDV